MLIKLLCCAALGWSSMIADVKPSKKQEVQAIDEAIHTLYHQWLLYRSRALWEADKGSRLQNRNRFYLESRRAYKEADLYFDAMKMIEQRIERLKERRAELEKQ